MEKPELTVVDGGAKDSHPVKGGEFAQLHHEVVLGYDAEFEIVKEGEWIHITHCAWLTAAVHINRFTGAILIDDMYDAHPPLIHAETDGPSVSIMLRPSQ